MEYKMGKKYQKGKKEIFFALSVKREKDIMN